ncbi:D-amino acid dehydrogenase [Cobetia sp. QF-1]|uniref:D-amino acid dehydrogenase n=1 Tax=Cobetia sp. QF-1 TaxID=1969833 RepID=UPI0011300B12|nr:D-amino acid dehydrogenase [Cobetia sp. QF-1]
MTFLQESAMQRHVTIIGGGVIGLTSAHSLVRAGHHVTLIDAHAEVASETSHANGGQLSYRYVAPLADSGVPLQAIKWLLAGSEAPLRFRPQLDLAQWRWALQFLAACHRRQHHQSASQLLSLAQHSQQILAEWREQDGLSGFAWQQTGKLVVHRDQQALNKAIGARIAPDDQQPLDARQCIALEPALFSQQASLAGGIFSASDETADCHAFCQALERQLINSGRYTRFASTHVAPLSKENGRIQYLDLIHIDGSRERWKVEEVVLAAGNHSAAMVRALGIRLPIQPLKGYSLTLPLSEGAIAPRISVTDAARKVVYANLGSADSHQLRIAAMVDIGSHERDISHPAIDEGRIAALRRIASTSFPEAGNFADATPWAGLRPSTPKGPPLIGHARHGRKKHDAPDNLWLNTGHGSLGFTLACGSADLITRAISGDDLPSNLKVNFHN